MFKLQNISDTTSEGQQNGADVGDKKKAAEAAARKELAKSARKKNTKNLKAKTFEITTRASRVLKPEDQRLKKFNLQNLKKVENQKELRFMMQEAGLLFMDKMTDLNLSMDQKCSEVAWMFKQFQKSGVFLHCDNIIFSAEGNTVGWFRW